MWKDLLRRIFLALAWIFVLLLLTILFATIGKAEKNDPRTWVKGGVVVGVSNEGRCFFKPFVKVDDAENDPDDGKPQILGFTPGEVVIAKDGKSVVWERVLEELFVPLNQHKSVHGRLCKCPPYQI